jgi:hypothetical protein
MAGKKIIFILTIFLLFSLTAQADKTVEMDNEWQMISPPVQDISIDELRQNGCNLVGGPWGWDSQEQGYFFAEEMSPERGYWIKVSDACSFTQEGPPAPPEPIQLEGGSWQLVSIPAYTSVLDFNPLVDKCSMTEGGGGPWAASSGEYSYKEEIEPQKGYFIKTGSDCQLELNTEQSDSSNDDTSDSSSSDTSDSSDTEDTSSEIGNSSSDLSNPKGWSYEGAVEPERFGVDGSGVMVLEAEKCGKIYYEKRFEEGEKLEFDLSFVAENWEGKAGLWYTDSGGDLVLDDQSIGENTVREPSDLNREGTVEFTQGATGPVQIGFSADAAICDQVGNAELRVDRID